VIMDSVLQEFELCPVHINPVVLKQTLE